MEKNIRNSLVVVSFAYFALASSCAAATLSLGNGGTHSVGDLFTVPVYVSTEDNETLNTVDAKLDFPSDSLKVTSIRDTGIIDVWPEKASYSNSDGTVSFLGVIYNPGFSGQDGHVLSVTFQALKQGDADISFGDSSVLANDGQGTEILTGSSGTTAHIIPAPQRSNPAPAPAPAPVTPPPAAAVQTATTTATTTPPALLDITAEPQPTAPAAQNLPFSISYDFLDTFGIFVMAISLVISFMLVVWYIWFRLHHVRRRMLRHLAATDTALHAELIELHAALAEEVARLEKEKKARELTMTETRILRKFSKLLKKTEHVMGVEFSRE